MSGAKQMKAMSTVHELTQKIATGKPLLLAGDERVLKQLPRGNWIAGTIPYFIGDEGGTFDRERVYVTELPSVCEKAKIQVYDKHSIETSYSDAADFGFSVIIIPAMSETHVSFALKAPQFPDFATRPMIGWISGVALDDLGKEIPKVFDGRTGTAYTDGAVVMHVSLPADKSAEIATVNIFSQSAGDTLEFENDGFNFSRVLVNGERMAFADYLKKSGLDVRLPLVADYYGVMINASFQAVDEKTGDVKFYAPLFKGIKYRHAAPFSDYVKQFESKLPKGDADQIAFSCNCILNYLYAELEGKKTGRITGPITFGEIGYQLLNQTMVYLKIS
jgi:hypothetical protein